MAGSIIYLTVLCLTAAVMIGIGVSQYKSRKPVGFYTGVKPPEEKSLRDVEAWNRKHGIMWIVYGGVIIGCGLVSLIAGVIGCDSVFLTMAECAVMVGGVFVMMWYHVRLERLYRI